LAQYRFGLSTDKIDKVNLGLGIFVYLFTFVVYLMTVQRTVSFWDCGEFIACSAILGIPHPPGAPLWVMIGRVFSMLPTASDIGFRINLISVLTSAGSAMFGYFVIAKFVRDWFGESITEVQRVGMYAAGLFGSLIMAFAFSNWNSAIEAEVYGAAMLLMMIIIWATLCWAERRDEPGANKWLILIAYLSVLSIGIHMTTYLVMPFIYLMIILLSEKLRRDWRIWVTGLVLLSIVVSIPLFVYSVPIWLLICAAIYLSKRNHVWALPFYLMLAGFAGWSCQSYIIIRANEKPAVNENAPDNWKKFMSYVERKQYGQGSMVLRMLTRRGALANQFGRHPHMGFWGYFENQYGITKTAFTFTLFPLGLWGLWELWIRRKEKGIPFFFMVLAATAGMVLYMNFADGTMAGKFANDEAYLEVRDRDYFWQPGFILFAMAIGLGFAALWDALHRVFANKGMPKAVYGMLVFMFVPLVALKANYHENDRSNNYVAWDYAYNLLMSADKDAVVFTNGDNDTFPVWALQYAYGIRTDVRIANLSLINTDWYIKQLKNEMGVPISYTDAQIEGLRPYRTSDGKVSRVQDAMIDNIIETNRWNIPIHFATTVSDDNRLYKGNPIDDHLEMKGMMYRVKKDSGEDMADVDATVDLYQNTFRFRGVGDSTVFKDENATRLTNNYSAGFLMSAEALRKKGDYNRAVQLARQSLDVVPGQWQTYAYLMQLYTDMDSLPRAEEIARNAPSTVDVEMGWIAIAVNLWQTKKDKTRAYQILNDILGRKPNHQDAYQQLVGLYYQDKQYDSLENLLNRWASTHPNDTDVQSALAEVARLKSEDTLRTGVRVRQVDVPRDTQ
jgi:tetratricopeptide (TPR) repeat protein